MEKSNIGTHTFIHETAKIGKNVEIGSFCIIGENVEIGDNTVVKNYVELRSGTQIGSNCYIDSRVTSSGNCYIGNNVTLRYDTIIARGCHIEDGCYFSPRVMTNNLDSQKGAIGGAKFGKECFIGTNAVIHHGIQLKAGIVIGSMSFVNKDIDEDGTYVGIPVKKIK